MVVLQIVLFEYLRLFMDIGGYIGIVLNCLFMKSVYYFEIVIVDF